MSHHVAPLQLKKRVLASTVSLLAMVMLPAVAQAQVGDTELPTDFNLVSGSVNNPVTTGAHMDVKQNSDRAVVDWGTFNIGKDASVRFDQNGANAVIVNRVTNSTLDGSQILGQLLANGKVVILDRNGVFFGATSKVDVGGILAATGTLDDANRAKFDNGQAFSLTNLDANTSAKIIAAAGSQISAKDGGLVALVAPHVVNNGAINARLGKVTLAAGKEVTVVDLAGDGLISLAADETLAKAYVENKGTIDAQGGVVTMATKAASSVVDNVVNMSGVVNATSFQNKNGKIVLSAPGGKVDVTGTLDVSRAAADSAAGTTAGDISITAKEINIGAAAELKANVNDAAAQVDTDIQYVTEEREIVLQEAYTGSVSLPILGKVYFNAPKVAVKVAVQVPTTTTSYNAEQGHGAGGTVTLAAEDVATIAGLIDVRGGTQGGDISISGRDVNILSGAVLDASIADAAARTGIENITDMVTRDVQIDVPAQSLEVSIKGVPISIQFFKGAKETRQIEIPAVLVNAYTSSNHAGNGGNITITATNALAMNGRADVGAAGLGGNGGAIMLQGDALLSFNGALDASSANGAKGDVTLRSGTVSVGDLVNTAALGATLSRANVLLAGDDKVAFTGDADLGGAFLLPNTGNLRLQAPTISLGGDLTVGTGALTFEQAQTINLGGVVKRNNGLLALALGRDDLSSTATTINVLGDDADLRQAIALASSTALSTVNVAAGNYTNNVLNDPLNLLQPLEVYKSLSLRGHDATLTALPVKVTADNVTVDGFDFVGGLTAISAKDVANLTVSNNSFTGFATAAVGLDGVTDARVADNTLTGMLADGIVVDGATGVTVEGNTVIAAGADGIRVSNSSDVDVRKNIVAGAGAAALALHHVSDADVRLNVLGGSVTGADISDSSDVNVALNLIGLTSGDGLRLTNVTDGKAYLNAIVEAGANGIAVGGGSDALVAGNIVYGAGANGIAVTGADNVRVLLNAVLASGLDGIYINGATNSVAIINAIVNSGANGVNVANSAGAIIAANLVQGAGADGIRLGSSDGAFVLANSVKDVQGSGVALSDSARVLAALNAISKTGQDGVAVTGVRDAAVLGNIVSGTGRDGVAVTGGENLLVAGNNIDDAGRDGIRVAGTKDVLVAGNDVDRAGRHGVVLAGADNALVALNKVSDSVSDGVRVANSTDVLVVENDVTDAGRDGIAVKGGARVAIASNDVAGAGRDGVSARDTANLLVSGNDVDDAQRDGLRVLRSGNVLAVQNSIRTAGRDGIAFAGSTGLIVDNDVTGARDGVSVKNGQALVVDNDITNVRRDGVVLRNADGSVVVLNTIDTAAGTGIAVKRSGNVWVVDNAVTNAATGVGLDRARDAVVYDNVITGGDTGIALKNSRRVVVAGNEVTGAQNGVVAAGVSKLAIAYNRIKGYVTNGLQLSGGRDVVIARNDLDGQAGATGIRLGSGVAGDLSGSDNVLIANNTITGNATGLEALAFNNGAITLSGNSFAGNTVGAAIGSGLIDMTGAANTFTGGTDALRFDRQSGGGAQADLALVGDTVGTTVFNGQGGYYVTLANGAFFENGQPMLLDGTQAVYDGVQGGMMSVDQLQVIRAKIHDFIDDPSLGLFFAGYTDLDDNLLMKRVAGNAYRSGKASIVVNNRPVTPAATTAPAAGQFFSIQDLAGLEPAAGGDDQPAAADLAGLEPAAGAATGACWSNVGGAVAAVSIDLSSDEDAVLNARSGCGGDI